MPATPTSEPSVITAGDSVSWTKSLPDYSADDGWVLNYAAQGASQINFASDTTTGTNYEVDLTPTDTADFLPGSYTLIGYVSNTGTDERVTISRTSLSIAADPASQSPSTHAEYTLYLIELAIEGRVPAQLEQTTIDGNSILRIPLSQLMDLRLKYQAEVRAEQDRARISGGQRSRRVMLARFRAPSSRFPFQP
jgi:hypothetical protein